MISFEPQLMDIHVLHIRQFSPIFRIISKKAKSSRHCGEWIAFLQLKLVMSNHRWGSLWGVDLDSCSSCCV